MSGLMTGQERSRLREQSLDWLFLDLHKLPITKFVDFSRQEQLMIVHMECFSPVSARKRGNSLLYFKFEPISDRFTRIPANPQSTLPKSYNMRDSYYQLAAEQLLVQQLEVDVETRSKFNLYYQKELDRTDEIKNLFRLDEILKTRLGVLA